MDVRPRRVVGRRRPGHRPGVVGGGRTPRVGSPSRGVAMSGRGGDAAGGAGASEADRDEDLGAIVEAEEDAVDRSVHPSGIVPVLQYVCARVARGGDGRDGVDRARRDEGIRIGIPRRIRAQKSKRKRDGRSTRPIDRGLTNASYHRAQKHRGDGQLGL